MNKFEEYYLTLGLQSGATPDEIQAAFQQISEKYHPDNDGSIDAQMKLHEAREAFNALMWDDRSSAFKKS
jgi:DnaJ-class molecular chaperone